jgi:methanogenic corrinoid protein MtbC1
MNPAAVLQKLNRLAPMAPIEKMTWMAMSLFSKNSAASNDQFSQYKKGSASDCQFSIQSIIESEIIPRLLKSEKVTPSHLSLVASTRALPTEEEIEKFVHLCISLSPQESQNFVDRLIEEGLSTEDIFLELITPAARYLGTQWELDHMDFTQVTHGLVRLHSIAHQIGFEYKDGPLIQGDVKRAMIASAPGSEHILGPTIVAEFFKKEGWQVVVEISPSIKELVHAVSNEWFDTVGLSVSIEQQLEDLSELIQQIKKQSRNPRVAVLLGGPIFMIQDLKASDFGAGGICTDAKQAVELARSLQPND